MKKAITADVEIRSVWDDIYPDSQEEAAEMKAQSAILMQIGDARRRLGLTRRRMKKRFAGLDLPADQVLKLAKGGFADLTVEQLRACLAAIDV